MCLINSWHQHILTHQRRVVCKRSAPVRWVQTTWTSFTASGQTLCYLLLTPLFKAYLSVRSAHCLLHLQLKNTPLARGDEQEQSWTLSSRRWQRHVWIKNIDNNSPTKKLCNLKTISNAQNKGTATSKRGLEQPYQIPERLSETVLLV